MRSLHIAAVLAALLAGCAEMPPVAPYAVTVMPPSHTREPPLHNDDADLIEVLFDSIQSRQEKSHEPDKRFR